MTRTTVLLAFGGRSPEHDISIRSATEVLQAIDRERFDVRLLGIDRQGGWRLGTSDDDPAQVIAHAPIVTDIQALRVDVVFPVLHGPYGEDGRFQGLLDSIDVPYVGSGVLASALCMDKVRCKQVLATYRIPVVPWLSCWRRELDPSDAVLDRIAAEIGFPCFVKPANMGSSIGVSKATDRDTGRAALELAAQYDESIVIERGLDAHEVEVAVLGNGGDETVVSAPGEVRLPPGVWYDYATKYQQDTATLHIPAPLPAEVTETVQAHALAAFRACGCSGLARVDFFVDRQSHAVYLNELNTLPGFTSISMYPKLMAHAGVSYDRLIERLCQLALTRLAATPRRPVDQAAASPRRTDPARRH
ncbi:MAG: D-alanine--D-alanine ligase [Myxococcales bacterium FL481]|nr:MAG: D-alanine--D-alanine ligase [Myxococcales bacterium FL481]